MFTTYQEGQRVRTLAGVNQYESGEFRWSSKTIHQLICWPNGEKKNPQGMGGGGEGTKNQFCKKVVNGLEIKAGASMLKARLQSSGEGGYEQHQGGGEAKERYHLSKGRQRGLWSEQTSQQALEASSGHVQGISVDCGDPCFMPCNYTLSSLQFHQLLFIYFTAKEWVPSAGTRCT